MLFYYYEILRGNFMNITIEQELDPVYEILGLLYLSNKPQWKEELKKELPTYGVEQERFYEKYLKILEKYVKSFQKYKVALPQEESFFRNCPEDLFSLYLAMGTEQREFLTRSVSGEENKLRSILAVYLSDHTTENMDSVQWQDLRFSLPDEAAIISFINQLGYKSEEKWRLLEILCNPCRWYSELFEMIKSNLTAYEKAKRAVEKPLAKLLGDYAEFQDDEFLKIAGTITREVTVYPALALPLAQFVLYTNCYQGLFCRYLFLDVREPDAAASLFSRRLKALSDKSKLDIIRELKQANRYNLELAEQLKLSPSTTSHHMNTLLSCGFVSVEKQDGKVYYSLNQKNIELFLNDLKELLL